MHVCLVDARRGCYTIEPRRRASGLETSAIIDGPAPEDQTRPVSTGRIRNVAMDKIECSGRRRFFALIGTVPLCAIAGPRIAQAASQAVLGVAAERHKFQEDSGMSFEEVFRFGFHPFINLLQAIWRRPGNERFIDVLQEVSSQVAVESVRNRERRTQDRSLASAVAYLKRPNRFWKNVITVEFVKETPNTCEIKVTECLWARTFREYGAGDIGYACICHPDFATAAAFNPKLRMERTKTLMQGDDYCNHRWILGEESPQRGV